MRICFTDSVYSYKQLFSYELFRQAYTPSGICFTLCLQDHNDTLKSCTFIFYTMWVVMLKGAGHWFLHVQFGFFPLPKNTKPNVCGWCPATNWCPIQAPDPPPPWLGYSSLNMKETNDCIIMSWFCSLYLQSIKIFVIFFYHRVNSAGPKLKETILWCFTDTGIQCV